jgi:hypothetical protein
MKKKLINDISKRHNISVFILPNGIINGIINGKINGGINGKINGKINGDKKGAPRTIPDVLKENPVATIITLAELTGKS